MRFSDYKYTLRTVGDFSNPTLIEYRSIFHRFDRPAYYYWTLFNKEFAANYRSNKNIFDYQGPRYADYLPLDIDLPPKGSNLEHLRKLCVDLLEYLQQEFDIELKYIPIYFSGSKGFHIYLPTNIFGFKPQNNLENIFKSTALMLFSCLPIHEFIDNKIFSRNRWLRLPNSINEKRGLYKIPLTINELRDLNNNEIINLAKSPRKDNRVNPRQVPLSKLLRDHVLAIINPYNKVSLNATQQLSQGVEVGYRNKATFELARLCRDSGDTQELALKKIQSWNKRNNIPYPNQELISTVSSTFRNRPVRQNTFSQSDLMRRVSDELANHHQLKFEDMSMLNYLLIHTNTQDRPLTESIILPKGSQYISYNHVAGLMNITKDQARNILTRLKNLGIIKLKKLPKNIGQLAGWCDPKITEIFG